MTSSPLAHLLRTPDSSTSRVLHGLPKVRLWIQACLLDLIRVKDSLALVEMPVDGRLAVVGISNVRYVFLPWFAAFTEEVSNAPFDDIGVKKEGILSGVVDGVRLDHANAEQRSIDEHGDDVMGDLVI